MQNFRGAAVAVLAGAAVLAACGGDPGVTAQTLPSSSSISSTPPATSQASGDSSAPATSSDLTTSSSTSSASSTAGESATSMSAADGELSAQEMQDRSAVQAQWIASWDAYLVAARTPIDQRQSLVDAIAIDPARANMLSDAQKFNDQGLETYGQLGHRISWPQPIDGQPTALIDDCQDRSQAGSQRTSTGDKVTVGVARDHYQGRLVRGEDGVWRVEQVFYLADEPC